jgi:micrococcal nuclease
MDLNIFNTREVKYRHSGIEKEQPGGTPVEEREQKSGRHRRNGEESVEASGLAAPQGRHRLLEFDAVRKDKYGRILAYVWKDGEMLNARMVADGYAYPLTIAPNVRYADSFVSLFQEAREKGKGLWGR